MNNLHLTSYSKFDNAVEPPDEIAVERPKNAFKLEEASKEGKKPHTQTHLVRSSLRLNFLHVLSV
jgi:hypothetical protein